MRITWLLIMTMFALSISLVGCGSDKGLDPSQVEGPKIGDEVQVGQASLKVLVIIPTTGDEAYRAKAGRGWVMVKIELANKGNRPLLVDPQDFTVISHEGEISSPQNVTFLVGPVVKGEVPQGEKFVGKMAFDVPHKDPLLKLKWMNNGQEAVITLIKNSE